MTALPGQNHGQIVIGVGSAWVVLTEYPQSYLQRFLAERLGLGEPSLNFEIRGQPREVRRGPGVLRAEPATEILVKPSSYRFGLAKPMVLLQGQSLLPQ